MPKTIKSQLRKVIYNITKYLSDKKSEGLDSVPLNNITDLVVNMMDYSVCTSILIRMKRGALIVIEGVDRTGKSTQAKVLVENLKNKNIHAEYRNFPVRDTDVGKMINSYLQSKSDLPDEVIHLLFSANRWERARNLTKMLEAGTTVIVDRYCYSGVAFSAAKGLDINWCKAPDVGLPKPDKVFFLTMPFEKIMERKGFGNERYEVLNFQKKVSELYMELKEDNWQILDADRSIDSIQEDLLNLTLNVVNEVVDKSIGKLWTKED